MASGLVALLDDIAGLTKLAAASLDDVGAAAGKAGSKAVGVVVDDAAVTPRYVTGLTPDRELPIIARIAVGSLRNKLLILLPAALLLSSFAPWAVTPLLMLGGAYLSFEGAEKLIEALAGGHDEEEAVEVTDQSPQERLEGPSDVEEEMILTTVRTGKAALAATLPGAVAVTVVTVCAIGAVSKVVRGRADVVVHQTTVVPSPKGMKTGLTTPQAAAAP